jgi:5'-deoxy-5'-methylthioadenosine phosphorylase
VSVNGERNTTLAVIGGSGLYRLDVGEFTQTHSVVTPFAAESVEVVEELAVSGAVLFLPRHGVHHSIPPHRINYRANLWALQALGVELVVAINAVGGISAGMTAGTLVVPNQLIDYTWGREHTFFTGEHALDKHVDFTVPYDQPLSSVLVQSAKALKVDCHHGGVYGCMQGPRLETAAEIQRLRRDGCDIVGMTGMPEAGLARELGLRYASLALVVNRAAGIEEGAISMEQIRQTLVTGMERVRSVLTQALPALKSLKA